jgi:octaprenyl-diphosphate synthase
LLDQIHVEEPLARLLADELTCVTGVFEQQLVSEHDNINHLCSHLEQYRGKMLRPALVVLAGLAISKDSLTHAHRVMAAVVEMIHMATLVHDDVLDDAGIRRGGKTINALHGNEMAVMLGDYLISNAFHLCSLIGDPEINRSLGEVTNTLCEGELIQLEHRDDHTLDESLYNTIVQKKTASLIGVSCRMGAVLSGGGARVVECMERFGIAAGVAFQITDDVLDLVGVQEVVGKSVGKDLDKGKLTLPVIFSLASADQQKRLVLLELLRTCDLSGLKDILLEDGSVHLALKRAQDLVTDAKSALNTINPSPARDLLATLADGILDRKF